MFGARVFFFAWILFQFAWGAQAFAQGDAQFRTEAGWDGSGEPALGQSGEGEIIPASQVTPDSESAPSPEVNPESQDGRDFPLLEPGFEPVSIEILAYPQDFSSGQSA